MSAVGRALSVLNRLAGSELIDRIGLRGPAQAMAYRAVKNGVVIGDAAAKRFKSLTQLGQGRASPPRGDARDLRSDFHRRARDDSRQRRARRQGAPAQSRGRASASATTPDEMLARINELGLLQYAIPESLGGVGHERAPVTSVLVAETLSYGDMALAAAGLSSVGVVNALVRWGSAAQQSRYLRPFSKRARPSLRWP